MGGQRYLDLPLLLAEHSWVTMLQRTSLGHEPALLGINSLTLALGHSAEGWAALLMGNILEGIRCYR